jgi:hypothetical protein
MGSHEAVRVLARWQQRCPSPQSRFHECCEAASGSTCTSLIPVEASHNVARVAPKLPQLLCRHRRTKRCHRRAEPVLVKCDYVEVTLDENRSVATTNCFASLGQSVDELSFLEDRTLGGVQVLRSVRRHHSGDAPLQP